MKTHRRISNNRRLLINGQTAVYHVISRTTCQQFLFGPEEKEVFRRMLWKQAEFHGIEILTYCVMSNHFHLLVRVPHEDDLSDEQLMDRYRKRYSGPSRPFSAAAPKVAEAILARGGSDATELRERLKNRMGNLPVFMRELKQCFGIWYNHKHNNFGTIWASRFKSLIVEDAPDALATVSAYIDLNPVRAGLTEDPANYRWCGYAEAIGGSDRARQGLRSIFTGENRSWQFAMPAYRIILFGKGRKAKGTPDKDQGKISQADADDVRESKGEMALAESLRKRVRYFSDGMILGSQRFIDHLFEENRSRFGIRRKTGAKPMEGNSWGGLHVLRGLKQEISE